MRRNSYTYAKLQSTYNEIGVSGREKVDSAAHLLVVVDGGAVGVLDEARRAGVPSDAHSHSCCCRLGVHNSIVLNNHAELQTTRNCIIGAFIVLM